MFAGPPPGAEIAYREHYRIVKEGDLYLSAVVGHTMVSYEGSLIVWGGYSQNEEQEVEYRSPSQIYVLPAAIGRHHSQSNMRPVNAVRKWIIYEIRGGEVPPSTSGASAVVLGTKMFIFGGYVRRTLGAAVVTQGHTNQLYVLDLYKEKWHASRFGGSALLPTPRDKATAWPYNNKCYFFGGYGPLPRGAQSVRFLHDPNLNSFVADEMLQLYWNNQLLIFDPSNLDVPWEIASVGGSVPCARAASSSVYFPERKCVLIFGGRHRETRLNDLHLLDMTSLVYTQVELRDCHSPEGRSWCSLSFLGDSSAILFGGFSNNNEVLSDCWRVEVVVNAEGKCTGRWIKLSSPSEGEKTETEELSEVGPRLWHTGAVVDGRLYLCGGSDVALTQATTLVKVGIRQVNPSSLLSICYERVSSWENDIELLPVFMQIRLWWRDYLEQYGKDIELRYPSFSQFEGLKLKDIINLSSPSERGKVQLQF